MKNKKWKELIAFSILLGISFVIILGKILGIPTPIELIHRWLDPIGRTIFKQF